MSLGMSKGKHAFKQCDVQRLVKAVIRAGLPLERLRVIHDTKNNKIIVEVRSDSPDDDTPNPSDTNASE